LPELAAGNLSFEHGLADRPGGWSWATWSTTGTGRFEWSTDACDGQRSVALIGESGTPNLVAELANLKLPKPGVYTVTLKYKTQGEARPHLSFIAQPPNAEQQYDRSGQLPLSETWREATWSFTAPAGVSTGRFHVRNSGVGTVWYDAIAIIPPP
ncbi:MAG: hypothetical protein HUU35_20510, partial [Armatimonadetes bacterium]|nr:hypothetical protein [Armatimonadota bacterium]